MYCNYYAFHFQTFQFVQLQHTFFYNLSKFFRQKQNYIISAIKMCVRQLYPHEQGQKDPKTDNFGKKILAIELRNKIYRIIIFTSALKLRDITHLMRTTCTRT